MPHHYADSRIVHRVCHSKNSFVNDECKVDDVDDVVHTENKTQDVGEPASDEERYVSNSMPACISSISIYSAS